MCVCMCVDVCVCVCLSVCDCFTQLKGDIVYINPCNVHWVQANVSVCVCVCMRACVFSVSVFVYLYH